jgi:hypothetical protein
MVDLTTLACLSAPGPLPGWQAPDRLRFYPPSKTSLILCRHSSRLGIQKPSLRHLSPSLDLRRNLVSKHFGRMAARKLRYTRYGGTQCNIHIEGTVCQAATL